MSPLYPPGLDENSAVAKLYPASWICCKNESKPRTIGITAVYTFCARHQKPLLPGTIFSPADRCRVKKFPPAVRSRLEFFSLAVRFLKNQNKKKNLTVQNSCVEYKDELDPARRVQRGH